jgi:hypothetical protein
MKENQKVNVRSADGSEKTLVLVRVTGETAYVCAPGRYREAVENPELAVGFPLKDVTALKREAANRGDSRELQ